MADYKPSVSSAQAAIGSATPIVRKDYPAGRKGVSFSLKEMARRMRDGRNDPYVRAWAGKAILAAGARDKGDRAQVQALLDAFRAQVMYAPDPVGTEMIVAPKNTLCLDKDSLCMRIGDCDDSVVALGSAVMAVGIPVKIIGQAFDEAKNPTHVLMAAKTKHEGWLKVDPSTKLNVGQTFPGTDELWVDPLDEYLDEMDAKGAAGDFVGVGALGFGDLVDPATKQATYDLVTGQLQTAVFVLEKATNDLGAALTMVEQTRQALRPGNLYDPEPSGGIAGILDFPPGGVWTQQESTIAHQLYATCTTIVKAGHEALTGARRVIVDGDAQDIFLELLPSDPWSLRTIAKSAVDQVIGVFQPPSDTVPSGGFTSKGKVLNQKQVADATDVLHTNPTTGVGAVQGVVIVLGVAAAVAIVTVSICYVLAKQAEAAKAAAQEAASQSIIQAIASGRMTPEQGNVLLATNGQNQKALAQAEVENKKADPFATITENVASVTKWLLVGATVLGGGYLLYPLAKTGIDEWRAKRTRALARSGR